MMKLKSIVKLKDNDHISFAKGDHLHFSIYISSDNHITRTLNYAEAKNYVVHSVHMILRSSPLFTLYSRWWNQFLLYPIMQLIRNSNTMIENIFTI
jgi:hypothetical protein